MKLTIKFPTGEKVSVFYYGEDMDAKEIESVLRDVYSGMVAHGWRDREIINGITTMLSKAKA